MAENEKKPSRRQQILEALAHELEINPGERITTAGLARAVGVSEAALYRHFPSKAKMFEGLIEFHHRATDIKIRRNTGIAFHRLIKIKTARVIIKNINAAASLR